MEQTPLQKMLAACDGSQTRLAARLGTSQQHIWWLLNKGGSQFPAKCVLAAEREFGFPRHELRPDLYPAEEQAA